MVKDVHRVLVRYSCAQGCDLWMDFSDLYSSIDFISIVQLLADESVANSMLPLET